VLEKIAAVPDSVVEEVDIPDDIVDSVVVSVLAA
jgi:hypothetical protein